MCPEWDPKKVHSPIQHKLLPKNPLPDDIYFEHSFPLIVKNQCLEQGKADVYIEDIISVTVETKDYCERTQTASLLVIHTMRIPINIESFLA